MEYTRLGSSGLKISRVAMGTMSFGEGDSGREGWPIPYEDALPFFRQAIDLGITFWDTANGYNSGTSEEAVGRALQTMRGLGWIETRRRGIRVLDLDVLRRAAA